MGVMRFKGGGMYHVYNQGNNRELIFFNTDNYVYFLRKMEGNLCKYCHLLAYCLMPNHFHWMIYVPKKYEAIYTEAMETSNNDPLTSEISVLLSSYTQGVNKYVGRSGSLFRSHTKSKCLNLTGSDDNYGITCFLYIHQNPLKAKLTDHFGGWPFSSYPDYAGKRNGTLCNKTLTRETLNIPSEPEEFEQFSVQTIDKSVLNNIFR